MINYRNFFIITNQMYAQELLDFSGKKISVFIIYKKSSFKEDVPAHPEKVLENV